MKKELKSGCEELKVVDDPDNHLKKGKEYDFI